MLSFRQDVESGPQGKSQSRNLEKFSAPPTQKASRLIHIHQKDCLVCLAKKTQTWLLHFFIIMPIFKTMLKTKHLQQECRKATTSGQTDGQKGAPCMAGAETAAALIYFCSDSSPFMTIGKALWIYNREPPPKSTSGVRSHSEVLSLFHSSALLKVSY